jgi:hypothetical protein
MGDVGHAVDEHDPRLAPAQRLQEHARMHGHAEPGTAGARVTVGLVFQLAHRLEPLGQREQ